MIQSRGKVSEAQKAAQKKYDQEKTKVISIKYTPVDMLDYFEFKKYLEENGESANALIKELIHNFLMTKDKHSVSHGVKNRSVNKIEEAHTYYPYRYMNQDTIESLYQSLGRYVVDEMLETYRTQMEEVAIKGFAEKYNKWLEDRIIKILIGSNPKLSTEGKQFEFVGMFERELKRLFNNR